MFEKRVCRKYLCFWFRLFNEKDYFMNMVVDGIFIKRKLFVFLAVI